MVDFLIVVMAIALISRRLFTIMDDIFYGRKPKPKEAPEWARFTV